ncbi:glycosyltransferase family 1 protein, partial [Dissoconium aciculare CBS 342.82]|uniref:Glycosyltransferase family 1 protein n=1 Tax=Dissoconium aciculare CBS 342.82 TaxID=1314786 RepID=A0A6J3MCI2_9PEZI
MYSSSSDSSSDDDTEDETDVRQAQKGAQAPRKRPQILPRSSDHEDQADRKRAQRGQSYSRFKMANKDFQSSGKVSKRDGRLNISINETANNGYLARALGQSLRHHLDLPNAKKSSKQQRYAGDNAKSSKGAVGTDADAVAASSQEDAPRPRLNIVIIIIGSRGDIQPFIRIGQILKQDHGHHVRLATHATFRDFVEEAGLEFFSIGGNPSELMAFMVRNPGLIPSLSTIREGEVARRREAMGLMFEGMWRACTNIRDGETDEHNLKLMNQDHPFVADAVIANPPSMAPPHIVERLGIPLFMAFTFPYTPTQHFPHPLANIRPGRSNVDTSYVNFMSYPLVEMMTWQGLGDVVNRFRAKTLRLEPVSALWAPGALYRMKVPYTYMWSPGLIPKPSDWGPEIDITGFVFLDLASNFKPPQDLADFLAAGPPPVYIGFGSIVVDDPAEFTKMIFEAAKLAGVRALVNKGWGGLGDGDDVQVPDNVFMLENTPHDWLFPKVAAVVHHGGAGTTAIGLKCGKPTMIVPFFGDQPFWGAEVAKHQAGALECIPYKKLTVDRLAEGIKQCLTEEAQVNAKRLAEDINAEGDGAANAVASFHRSLPFSGPNSMRCSILEDRVAVWHVRGTSLRLSAVAAEILLQKRKIKRHDLKLLRHCSWNDFDGPGEPITGSVAAITDSVFDIGTGVGMVPLRVAKQIRKQKAHEHKKRQAAIRKAEHRRKKDAARAAEANAELERQNAEKANGDAHPPAENAEPSDSRPSIQREQTASTQLSVISTEGPDVPLPTAIVTEVRSGLRKSAIALLTMPNDLHLAVAQGFHNAPRLWGDATVRKPTRITGIKSGLIAARREFVYGVYDGFTGVVTQPIGGWRDASATGAGLARKLGGFGTGIAKGLGGLVVKNVSAIITPPAYFSKGVLVWTGKRMEGEGTKKFLRRSHFTVGFVELLDLRN